MILFDGGPGTATKLGTLLVLPLAAYTVPVRYRLRPISERRSGDRQTSAESIHGAGRSQASRRASTGSTFVALRAGR
jgi:hypothetical protein